METHEKIRVLRELNQWTQEEMAEKLEMSAGGYAKIERGDSQLNLSRLEQIAKIFNINVLELVQNDKGFTVQINDIVNQDNGTNQISVYSSLNEVEIERLKMIIQHKDELLQQKINENKLLLDMLELIKQKQLD
jgi:DNA-binding protein